MRILVTGSRDWTDYATLDRALFNTWVWLGEPEDVVLVHGGCPTGADAMAARIWELQTDWQSEVHPADWAKHGKAAGPIRNQHMVDLGADVCVAFPLGESRGTRHCMAAAEKAGIPVLNYGDPS